MRTLTESAIAGCVVAVFVLVQPTLGGATVQGRGRVSWSGAVDASLYNGSNCAIIGLYYRLVPRDSAPAAETGHWQAIAVAPQHSGRVLLRPTRSAPRERMPRWYVDSVQGRCPASH